MKVSVKEIDSIPSEIVLHRSIDRSYHLRRTDSGWVAAEEVVPWKVDTAVARGVITSSLFQALQLVGPDTLPDDARAALTFDLADVYEYRVDMSRDLRVGDSVRVLFERKTHPTGATRIGKILASTFSLSGQTTEAVRFESKGAIRTASPCAPRFCAHRCSSAAFQAPSACAATRSSAFAARTREPITQPTRVRRCARWETGPSSSPAVAVATATFWRFVTGTAS
jgi:hypothetical protein